MVDCEPADARRRRREAVGRSAGEAFRDLILSMEAGAACDLCAPVDAGARSLPTGLAAYDGAFLTGSPLHLYEETPETRRLIDFMRSLLASGAPSFGSCAGLQAASVAAGGEVRPMAARREIGFARRIRKTAEGALHPLLAGRPAVFEAPAVHADEVAVLPPGARHLAENDRCRVQAAEITMNGGVFWGVQYHPELSLQEVAASLRREGEAMVEEGLVETLRDVEAHARLVEALARSPDQPGPAWRLGLDGQCADAALRRAEIQNFIHHLVRPLRSRRARA